MALFDVIKQRDRSLINTPLKTSKNYPTITEKSWWAVRNKFKASIPSFVTPSYILSFLPLNSIPSANSNVVVPLKRMGLIDFNGVPTSLAKQWRLDQEYKKVCKKILELVYPPELLALFPDSVIDRPLVKSWFMAQGIGEESSRKMARVFCMLKTSDLKKVSMEYRKKDTRLPNGSISSTESASKDTDDHARPEVHIDLQIHISPDSTPELVNSIFSSMAKHLYGKNQ